MRRKTACGNAVEIGEHSHGTVVLTVSDNADMRLTLVELSMEDAEALVKELTKFIENENENRACGGRAVSR